MLKFASTILFLVSSIYSNAFAQFGTQDVVQVETFLSVDRVRKGDTFKVGFQARIDHEWHINSNKPSEDFLIPTEVRFENVPGLEFLEPNYPEGKLIKFEFSEKPLSVYEDEIMIWANVQAAEKFSSGDIKITGQFSYQACNNTSCLAPTKISFEIIVIIADANESINFINEDKFVVDEFELGELQGKRDSLDNKISQLMAGKGIFLTLFFIFLGGLALNLTPCVYPIIPITISYFVGQSSGKLGKSFFLAMAYVLGMSITYSLLGVFAALTGGLLGSSLQNPIILIAIAVIFLLFASSMFGAFEIRIPTFLSNLAGGSKQGAFGSLFMGLTVGIVAAPCIGPFVISLLTYVAAQGDPFKGFLMFFILSLGLGLPFLVLGTFSGLIKNLPRSGDWMVWVKKVFGVIMIGMAIYFISTLIPEMIYIILITGVAVSGGLFVGFLDKSTASIKGFRALKSTIGVIMILFGIWTSVSAWQEANVPHINWQVYDEALVARAKAEGKPVLIDFYADWCIPCKQIERTLFTEFSILEMSEQFIALKANLTKDDSEQVKSIRKKYRVLGVPTVILIDIKGQEYIRFTDELVNIKPEEFLRLMEEAL